MRTFVILLSFFMALLGRVVYAHAPLQGAGLCVPTHGLQHGSQISAQAEVLHLIGDATASDASEEPAGHDGDGTDLVAWDVPARNGWFSIRSLPSLHATRKAIPHQRGLRGTTPPLYLWNRVFRI